MIWSDIFYDKAVVVVVNVVMIRLKLTKPPYQSSYMCLSGNPSGSARAHSAGKSDSEIAVTGRWQR